jgi:tetratricopeptide (TPR) repeat protein
MSIPPGSGELDVRSLKSEAIRLVGEGKYSLATEKINEALFILQTKSQLAGTKLQLVGANAAAEQLPSKSQLEYIKWMTLVGNIVILVKSGAIKRAKDILSEMAQLPPEYQSELTPNYLWHYVNGLILLGEKKYEPAVDEFEQAISVIDKGTLPDGLVDLAHNLIVNAIIAKAWIFYLWGFGFRAHWSLTETHGGLEGRSLLEMPPNDKSFSAFVCFVIGYILYVRGEAQSAIKFLEEGKIKDNLSPFPWYLEADISFDSNDSKALECYEEILKRNEEFAEARNNKAVILARRKIISVLQKK